MAEFIKGIDDLVKTKGELVAVDGRLMTIDGFALNPDTALGFPHLEGTFSLTAYLTPPDQGVTAGASPEAPAPETLTAAPTAATTGEAK